MKTKYLYIAVTFTLALVFCLGIAIAEEVVIPVEDYAIIADAEDLNSRYLADPEISIRDTSIVIDQAMLELQVNAITENTITYASIEVYPITRQWELGNASWTCPWTRPGGDINEIRYAQYAISEPGVQVINIDMTDLHMSWHDDLMPYHGFMIIVSSSSLAQVQFLNGPNDDAAFASLRLQYTYAEPGE